MFFHLQQNKVRRRSVKDGENRDVSVAGYSIYSDSFDGHSGGTASCRFLRQRYPGKEKILEKLRKLINTSLEVKVMKN